MATEISERDLVLTGPETISGRYMRRFWHPVYRSEDLPTGHAKPVRIMNEDFTLYRGESGTAYAVAQRCAHRGTQLSVGYVEGDCIRCLYHGWKYDGSGLAVERPGDDPASRRVIRIRHYPTREYLGLVFVYMGEGEPPPLLRFPRMEEDGVLDITVDVMPVNFRYSLENDAFHFAFTHRDLLEERGLSGLPEAWSEESDWGITTHTRWPNRNSVGVSQKGMPNVGYIVPAAIMMAKGTKHALHVSWRVPVDDESHVTYRANLTTVTGEEANKLLASRSPSYYDRAQIPALGDAVLAGKLRLADIKDRTHIEFIQDYVAQVGQGTIATREHEELSRTDSSVLLFRRILKRELSALADGRPLKEWRLTEAIDTPAMTL